MSVSSIYQDIDQRHYLPTFKRMPLTLVKGKGSTVWDDQGNKYLDAMAGIAVNSLGHSHPKIVEAVQKQAAELMHISNFFLSKPQALLAQKLAELSGLQRVFFANSGAEANEGAIKIARKYAHGRKRGGEIISFTGCFHGRTLGTIATGKKAMQKGFEPIPSGFKQVPFNNIEAVKEAVSSETAAIIIEPIQGEGGIQPAKKSFMKELRQLCTDRDILLIFDEIQCGMGRTGYMFAKDYYGIQPDILTSAKALGAGIPIGAVLSSEKVAQAIHFGDHGTTFGGNPLATATALAAIQTIEKEDLLKKTRQKGEWLKEQIQKNNPTGHQITEVRGMGLMIGVVFEFDTKPLVERMMHKGVLANATAGNVLRLVPPLVISYKELDTVLTKMYIAVQELKNEK